MFHEILVIFGVRSVLKFQWPCTLPFHPPFRIWRKRIQTTTFHFVCLSFLTYWSRCYVPWVWRGCLLRNWTVFFLWRNLPRTTCCIFHIPANWIVLHCFASYKGFLAYYVFVAFFHSKPCTGRIRSVCVAICKKMSGIFLFSWSPKFSLFKLDSLAPALFTNVKSSKV